MGKPLEVSEYRETTSISEVPDREQLGTGQVPFWVHLGEMPYMLILPLFFTRHPLTAAVGEGVPGELSLWFGWVRSFVCFYAISYAHTQSV